MGRSHVIVCAGFFSPLLWVRQNKRSQECLSNNILLHLRENTFSFIKIITIVRSMISHIKIILLHFFLARSLTWAPLSFSNKYIYLAMLLLEHKEIHGLRYTRNLDTNFTSTRTILNHFLQNVVLDHGNKNIPVGTQKLTWNFVLNGDYLIYISNPFKQLHKDLKWCSKMLGRTASSIAPSSPQGCKILY